MLVRDAGVLFLLRRGGCAVLRRKCCRTLDVAGVFFFCIVYVTNAR